MSVKTFKLPTFDCMEVADYEANHVTDYGLGNLGGKVFADAKSTAQSPAGEAIMHLIRYEISNLVGEHLHPSNAFAWVFPTGSYIKPHLDRQEMEYYCGFMVEQDREWTLDWQDHNNNWVQEPTEVGKCIAMDGVRMVHRRPVYHGKRAISVVMTYTRDENTAAMIKKVHQYQTLSIEHHQEILDKIGFDRENLPCYQRRFSDKPIHVFDLPLDNIDFKNLAKTCRGYVYHHYTPDKDAPILKGYVMTPMLELTWRIKNAVSEFLGKQMVSCGPICYMCQSADHRFVRQSEAMEDYLAVIPLDKVSSRWKYAVNGHVVDSCPYRKAILFAGYPAVLEFVATYSAWANFAVIPLRTMR